MSVGAWRPSGKGFDRWSPFSKVVNAKTRLLLLPVRVLKVLLWITQSVADRKFRNKETLSFFGHYFLISAAAIVKRLESRFLAPRDGATVAFVAYLNLSNDTINCRKGHKKSTISGSKKYEVRGGKREDIMGRNYFYIFINRFLPWEPYNMTGKQFVHHFFLRIFCVAKKCNNKVTNSVSSFLESQRKYWSRTSKLSKN